MERESGRFGLTEKSTLPGTIEPIQELDSKSGFTRSAFANKRRDFDPTPAKPIPQKPQILLSAEQRDCLKVWIQDIDFTCYAKLARALNRFQIKSGGRG